jgi:hypothetical protein
MTRFVFTVLCAIMCTTNAFAVARWVNNQGATRPATVQLGCATYVTATTTYTNVQSAINAAVSGDIVYITDGVYNNPFEYTSTNCSYAGTAQDANLLFDLNSKFNIIITSSTGSYCNSNAVLRGKGFNFRSCNNVTVQGLRLDSIRVNAFYNSNCCGWGPSSNITIKDNSITNVRGHGIKTDDGGPTGVSINRGTWNITGNLFQNIGFYTANGLCSQASTTAIWLAEAGATFNINNNTIINTNWAGILCMGWGGDNGSYTGMLTVSGNRIDSTLDAGIQLGFPLGVFYYPNGANINNNKITHANYSNKIGIGALTMLANNVYGVTMTNNDISESFNGLAIEIAGWQNSLDVKNITFNNFYNLTSGSYAVTHIAGISPNGLFGTGDSLTKYNLANNYFGSATGPTYALNPGGTGTGLKKDVNVLGGGTYSLGEFQFTPFATAPNTFVNPVSPCFSIPVAVNDNGATLAYNGANGVVNILTNDRDSNANPTAPVNGAGQFTLDLDIATIGLQTSFTNAQGVWTLNATTAEVTFDPALNYSGTAVLPYTLCDPSPTCNCVNANIEFIVNPCLTTMSTTDSAVCAAALPFTWNGITISTAGLDTAILVNAGGCDSLAIIDLTINPTSATTINDTICQGATYIFNGIAQTIAGTYLDTMMNANGCDSFITLNLIVNPTSATTINDTICQGGTYTFNGIAETMAGTYLDTMMSANGCDSFVTLNLFVKPTSATTINDTICQGGTYTFNGIAESIAGAYLDTMLSANGCDSFITLNLYVNSVSTTTLYDTICQGTNYMFNGIAQSATGIYLDTLTNTLGCDSFIVLDLTVNAQPVITSAAVSSNPICNGDTALLSIEAVDLSSTLGAASDYWLSPYPGGTPGLFGNANSIYYVKINIPNTVVASNLWIYNYINPITTNVQLGLYTDASGLPGNLIALTAVSNNLAPAIAQLPIAPTLLAAGDYWVGMNSDFTWYGFYSPVAVANSMYGEANIFGSGFPSVANTGTIAATAFSGAWGITAAPIISNSPPTFMWSPSTSIDNSGSDSVHAYPIVSTVYTVTITSSKGCSITSAINISVIPTSASTINDTICQGTSFTFNGIAQTVAGTYLDTLINANGCDSFITLNLVVKPTSATTISDTICQGGTYTFNGIAETMAGAYLDTMMNANGCDSFITLNLVVNPTSATTINDTICQGGTYTFNGIAETLVGTYLDTMMNANGCDSFITLNLFIKPTSSAIINDTICQGDGYIFNGITQTMSGSYFDTLISANGCDSLVTLDLYVSALPIVIANVNDAAICLGDTLLLTGSGAATYTWISPSETPTDNVAYVPMMSFSNSIYTVTGTSSAGCQSTSTISITVSALPNFTIIPNITPCSFGTGGSASISFTSGLSTPYMVSPSDGITISASDIDGIIGGTNYTITATNANSCIATSLLNIADFGNGNLANATATNATSTVGNTCASSNQIDGSFISYYGASCDDLIASVSDSTGGNALGTVSTCVTINATAIQFALEPYSARWFDITPSSQGPALITLYFTQDDFDGYNLVAPVLSRPLLPTGPSDIAAFANMRVLKLSGGPLGVGTLPLELVPGVTWNVLNNYWEVSIAIDSFSTFYLHTVTPPIPLAIDMQLSGSTTTTTDELSWSIANANDIVNYDVQILQNGEFKALATVVHTAQQREYSYRNNALATNTYRIAANTGNGLQKYSNTITLQRTNRNSLAVYPNPATNVVTIDVHAMSGSNATIHVYDIAGKLVLTNYFTLLQGGNTHTIDLSALANGTYTIKVSDAKAWHAQTLLQKH